MKAVVLALSLLALACFAVATEQTAGADLAVSDAGVELGNAPFVPQAVDADVDEVGAEDEDEVDESDENEFEDESDQEDSDSDEFENEEGDETESDDSDEVEQEDEEGVEQEEESSVDEEEADSEEGEEEGGEFSFLEAMADATTTAAAAATTGEQAQTETAAKAENEADARPLRAPKPAAFKFHPERIVAQTSKNEDPEMAKLNLALEAVKEDILATNKQITDERKWVIAVAKIIASYNDKMKRVEAHIVALRKEMKKLYRKKKQIENLKLQKALEAKLKEARDELATLTHSLKHVQSKQGELNKSGRDLRETIAGIQAQLAKLRGQQMRSKPKPKKAKKAKKPKAAPKPKAVRKPKRKAAGKPKPSRKPKAAPKKRCKKGQRFSKKAKKCVPAKKKGKLFGQFLKV